MARIGVIGDIHEPVSRIGYLDFCADTFDKFDCDTIVAIGDIVDWHGISFHVRQPECPGTRDEYVLALDKVQRWAKRFPKLKWCIGNHDERPARLARTVSIPEFMLKPYNELWGVPDWELDYDFIIDDTLYTHGTEAGGVHPAWNVMNKSKMSVVMGHCHSRGGVKWSVNPKARYFAVDTGCGIDDRTFQFAYSKHLKERSFLGCAVILDGQPVSIAMPCAHGEKYHDSRFHADKTVTLVPIGKFGKPEDKVTTKVKTRVHPQKVHFAVLGGTVEQSACKQDGGYITGTKEDVTCGNCKRTKKFKESK